MPAPASCCLNSVTSAMHKHDIQFLTSALSCQLCGPTIMHADAPVHLMHGNAFVVTAALAMLSRHSQHWREACPSHKQAQLEYSMHLRLKAFFAACRTPQWRSRGSSPTLEDPASDVPASDATDASTSNPSATGPGAVLKGPMGPAFPSRPLPAVPPTGSCPGRGRWRVWMGARRILWTLKMSVLSWGVGPEGVKGREMGASRVGFWCMPGAAAMHTIAGRYICRRWHTSARVRMRVEGCMLDGCMDGGVGGWVGGWMNEWVGGWMDGWVDG